jgi:trans-aconitate methyltransferase
VLPKGVIEIDPPNPSSDRRQALPQLSEVFAGRDQRKLRLLDLGCGTGRFLDFVKQTWPRLQTTGLDMEPRKDASHRSRYPAE